MKWHRRDGKDLDDYRCEHALVQRFYSPKNAKWPLIQISIYAWPYEGKGYRVAASRKAGEESWWDDSGVPLELLPVMAAILTEFATAVPS